MKTMPLASWFALILLCEAALGQGLVNLNNNFTPTGASAKAYIIGHDGLPMAKALGSVEILDSSWNVIKSGGLVIAGIFWFGVVEIPGIAPGGSGSIIIRVWDNSTGASYDTAIRRSYAIVTLVGLGGGSIQTPSLAMIGNFTGISLECLFCTSWWPTYVHIEGIGLIGDQVMVRAICDAGHDWALWSSTNLVEWFPVGPPQQSELPWWQLAEFEWTVPRPPSPTLYRVIQVEN
ncbi:MAG: hypothetical protein RIS76_3126 [Verrucomicrobiota bacterium]|jgi:hypothetical protein